MKQQSAPGEYFAVSSFVDLTAAWGLDHDRWLADLNALFLNFNIPLGPGLPFGSTKTGPTTGALVISGTRGDDRLVIDALGIDSGTYSLNGGTPVAFTGVISFTFDGGAGNDQVTVNNPDGGLFAPAGGIFVNGGTQSGDPGDGLRLVGGVADTATYNTDAHHADGKDGSIVLNLGSVTATYTYTGLEPLANTGTAANVVFNLPAGAGTAFLEDDGVPFNGISRLRSFEGSFETTDFAHPTGSLTINSGAGQTIIVTLDNDSSIENLIIGSLTNTALNPDAINIGNVSVGNTITLAATGEITELFSDAANDISAVRVAMSAGTGIGVGNAIELAPPLGFIALEAQTNTGGIFLSSTASLNIGGVTSSLTGLKVITSGDIDIVTGGTIVLQDTDGPEVIRGGSSSGNVRLAGNHASADLIITVDRDAIVTPAGSIDARVGRDILLGTAGANFDNDVRASGFVFLRGERDFILDGQSNISSDDFGLNTGGSVNVGAGGNITIANAQGNGASIGANGNAGAGVQLFTGAGGLLSLNAPNPAALFSTSGNVTAHANRLAIQSGSGISALGHTVTIQPVSSAGWNINLGSTGDVAPGTLELSDAELDRITATTLRIGEVANPGNITVSSPITANGHYDTLSLRTGGGIIDGTPGEQSDLSVSILALNSGAGAGSGVGDDVPGDLDVAVNKLAFANIGGAVNVTNTGALTIAAVEGLTTSSNIGTTTTVSVAGPLTVGASVASAGQLAVEAIDSPGSGENLTVLPGVTVQSAGTIFLMAGDTVDLQAGSIVQAGTINLLVDAEIVDPDPGTGATANLNGTLLAPVTTLRGNNDPDTYNIAPSASSQFFIGGLAPNTLPGDTLNVTTAGATSPTLSIFSVDGNGKNGQYTFGNRQPVNFTDIERLNTTNGALTVNGTALNDTLVVNSTGPGSGSFTLTGALAHLSTFGDEDPTSVSNFGVPNTATYGQVITATATRSKLSAFSFQMNLPSTVAMRGEVYAWDGTKATGPALFESAPVSTSGSGSFEVVTFNAGGVSLTPGQQYVLFASTSKDQPGHSGFGPWVSFSSDVYSGGSFVYLNNGGNASQWTTSPWTQTTPNARDLAFTASFDLSATVGFSNFTSFGFNGLDGNDTVSYATTQRAVLINLAGQVATDGIDTITLSSIEHATGSPFNDTIVSSDGPNRIDGGGGIDTVSYASAVRGQLINLTGQVTTDGINTDTLSSIENAIGSPFNDDIFGDASANILDGGAGGSDRIFGGGGSDTVSYASAVRRQLINLTGQVTTDGIDTDTLSSIENAIGSRFNDDIFGDGAANILDGGFGGSDRISGGGGSDTVSHVSAVRAQLINLAGQVTTDGIDTDTLSSIENATGSSFDDTIVSSDGPNRIDGGAGKDTVSYVAAPRAILINLTDQVTTDGINTDTLSSIENATGSPFNDDIFGDALANILDGGSGGSDRIFGGGGVDTVSHASAVRAQLINLAGQVTTDGIHTDTLSSIENAIGSRFNDDIFGDGLANILDGGSGGSDRISGGGGSDTVSHVSAVRAQLINLAGQVTTDGIDTDTLSSIENAVGSRFNDDIFGDGANNILDGGPGGSDRIFGGGGSDTVSHATATEAMLINLAGQVTTNGVDTDTLSSIENAVGSRFNDTIYGDSEDNVLDGGVEGSDQIFGGLGKDSVSYATSPRDVLINLAEQVTTDGINNDTLSSIENAVGSAFNDSIFGNGLANVLDGGTGVDSLFGGGGDDTFVFRRGQAAGDTVVDFAGNGAAAGDTLQFIGYGPGASFTQIDATHWQVNSGDGLTHETITFQSGAAVHATDVLLV